MDKQQFSIFAMALRTYYPKENLLPNDKAMELWFREVSDIPYEVAELSLRKWVSTNKWSPSISEIRQMANEVSIGEIPDWGDAWEKVMDSIWTYGWYRADEALETFDDLTREAVKRIGYSNICHSENIAADRANFRMVYERLAERKKQDAQISPNVMALIHKTQNLIEERNGDGSNKIS